MISECRQALQNIAAELDPAVILSGAKDLRMRILRSFAVFEAQDDALT